MRGPFTACTPVLLLYEEGSYPFHIKALLIEIQRPVIRQTKIKHINLFKKANLNPIYHGIHFRKFILIISRLYFTSIFNANC